MSQTDAMTTASGVFMTGDEATAKRLAEAAWEKTATAEAGKFIVLSALASSDLTPATEAGGAAMLAASPLPSSSGTGWRSMDSAPHGVEVLLATPPFRCMGEQARWEMRVGCASWGERIGGFSNRSQDAYATHWMPLPSAPVSDGGVE